MSGREYWQYWWKAFFNSLVKYITDESTMADNPDTSVAPDKVLVDKEKGLLEKLKVSQMCVSVERGRGCAWLCVCVCLLAQVCL